jgi:hypothetical protein
MPLHPPKVYHGTEHSRPGCAGLLASRQQKLSAVRMTASQHRRDARVPFVAWDAA